MKEPRQSLKNFSRVLHGIIDLSAPPSPFLVGVLPGEGVGPEVIQASLNVLSAVQQTTGIKLQIATAGAIGFESEKLCGRPLSQSVSDFCGAVFRKRGAILCGPGGGRFVYDLRKEFDLFCKIIPITTFPVLRKDGVIRVRLTRNVNILLIRENIGGVYQGAWQDTIDSNNQRYAEHSFGYHESDVTRILEVGARLAVSRTGRMTVVIKDGGIPSISRLWRDCASSVASRHGIEPDFINIDYAGYYLIQHANRLDVVVASNLFGDVLGDLSAVLCGSRALSYSGNFSHSGAAVYQTNHGAALDIQGKNCANPASQILSMSMMLRESFGLLIESNLIRKALIHVWQQGFRTPDLSGKNYRVVGTSEMGALVAEAVTSLSSSNLIA